MLYRNKINKISSIVFLYFYFIPFINAQSFAESKYFLDNLKQDSLSVLKTDTTLLQNGHLVVIVQDVLFNKKLKVALVKTMYGGNIIRLTNYDVNNKLSGISIDLVGDNTGYSQYLPYFSFYFKGKLLFEKEYDNSVDTKKSSKYKNINIQSNDKGLIYKITINYFFHKKYFFLNEIGQIVKIK